MTHPSGKNKARERLFGVVVVRTGAQIFFEPGVPVVATTRPHALQVARRTMKQHKQSPEPVRAVPYGRATMNF